MHDSELVEIIEGCSQLVGDLAGALGRNFEVARTEMVKQIPALQVL